MVKAIIYDFDGVLADTLDLHMKGYGQCLSKFGIKASKKEIINKCFNKLDNEAAYNFKIKDVRLFSKYRQKGISEAYKHIKFFLHLTSIFKEISKSNLLLAIGSLRRKGEISLALKKLPIRKFFKIIHTDDQGLKDKYEIFLVICKRLKVKPNDVLVVGDADNDLIAVKKMGAKSVLFYPKKHREFYRLNDLKKLKPDFIIKDHGQILKIIKKLIRQN